jgi:hypothetical protein
MDKPLRIPYCPVKKGIRYFEPTPAMKRFGFEARCLGPDGPDTQAEGLRLYADWHRARRGEPSQAQSLRPQWPLASVGHAFERYMRTVEWEKKAAKTRREWQDTFTKWIGPALGNVAPSTIEFEMLSELRQLAYDAVSLHQAHRVIKIWRALWNVMAAMKLCEAEADPSKAIRNSAPKGRSATWSEAEAVKLIKSAWRMGYHGLAAGLAVMWDTQFQPVDVRRLCLGMRRKDGTGTYFDTARGKTEKAVIGTVTRRAMRIVDAYVKALDFDLHADAPIFRNRSLAPYSSDTMGDDFRDVRNAVFPGDTRQMMDFRRSGAIEAVAGGVDPLPLSQKMGNALAQSRKLQDTYMPRQAATVRLADEARKRGRKVLKGNG